MKGAFCRLAFARPCRRLQWLYLWILVGCLTQFPAKSACSWWGTVRRAVLRRTRRPRSWAPMAVGPLSDFSLGRSPADEQAEQAAALLRAHSSLMSLRLRFIGVRDWLPQMQSLAAENYGLQAVGICVEEAVSVFEPEAGKEAQVQESSPLLHDIIPHGQVLLLESAVTGGISWYEFHRVSAVWTVVDSSGCRYMPQMWPLDEDAELRRRRALEAPAWIQERRDAKNVFGVPSWMDLETRFHVLAPHDLLVSPGPHPHIQLPHGSIMNAIFLWRYTVTTLVRLSHTIARRSRTSTQGARQAWLAKCNLTLQVIRLVGQIASRGVTLPRLDPYQFVSDKQGTLFLMPREDFKREQVGTEAACSGAGCGGWRPHDRTTNARDMSRVLLFVWCPDEATGISIYRSTPDLEEVNAVLEGCRSIPPWIQTIVRAPFEANIDAAYILLSSLYNTVYYNLRQELEQPASSS